MKITTIPAPTPPTSEPTFRIDLTREELHTLRVIVGDSTCSSGSMLHIYAVLERVIDRSGKLL